MRSQQKTILQKLETIRGENQKQTKTIENLAKDTMRFNRQIIRYKQYIKLANEEHLKSQRTLVLLKEKNQQLSNKHEIYNLRLIDYCNMENQLLVENKGYRSQLSNANTLLFSYKSKEKELYLAQSGINKNRITNIWINIVGFLLGLGIGMGIPIGVHQISSKVYGLYYYPSVPQSLRHWNWGKMVYSK